jgi:CBS domain-containing protein
VLHHHRAAHARRAHEEERPRDYMSAVEEELAQRPDAASSGEGGAEGDARAPRGGGGADAAAGTGAAAAAGILWPHSPPTVAQARAAPHRYARLLALASLAQPASLRCAGARARAFFTMSAGNDHRRACPLRRHAAAVRLPASAFVRARAAWRTCVTLHARVCPRYFAGLRRLRLRVVSRHAMRAMLARHVSGAPVVDGDGALVGILSQRDVLRAAAALPRDDAAAPPAWLPLWHALDRAGDADADAGDAAWLLDAPVSDVMSLEPVFARPGQLLADAAALMARRGVNRLPVLDRGRIVGLLARADVVAAFGATEDEQQGRSGEGEPHHDL